MHQLGGLELGVNESNDNKRRIDTEVPVKRRGVRKNEASVKAKRPYQYKEVP
jgi:hypothetical protein